MERIGYPKLTKWNQKGIKTEPKGNQSEPRNLQKHHLRNRVEKVRKKGEANAIPFVAVHDQNSLKIQSNKLSTKTFTQKLGIDVKWDNK